MLVRTRGQMCLSDSLFELTHYDAWVGPQIDLRVVLRGVLRHGDPLRQSLNDLNHLARPVAL